MKKVLVIAISVIFILFFILIICFIPKQTNISFTKTNNRDLVIMMKNDVCFDGNEIYTKTHSFNSEGKRKVSFRFLNAKAFAVHNKMSYYLDEDGVLTISDANGKHFFNIDNVKKFALYKNKLIVLVSHSFDEAVLSIYSQNGEFEKNIGSSSIYDFCSCGNNKILYRDNGLETFFEYDLHTDDLIDYPICVDKDMYYTFSKSKFICNEKYVVFYEGFWDSNCIVSYNISQQKYAVLLYDKKTKYDIKAELLDDTLYFSCEAVDMKYSQIEDNENCGIWKVDLKTGEKTKLSNEKIKEFLVVNDKMLGVLKGGELKFLE